MKVRSLGFLTAGVLWLAAVGGGLAMLSSYSHTPGGLGSNPPRWPLETSSVSSERLTLLVFLHPECPCSRATLSELARVLATSPVPMDATAYFHRPGDWSPSEEEASLWRDAGTIAGLRLAHDPDGAISKRFGAETSGTVVLYSRAGKLLFAGGITGSRGHEGMNPNEDALLAALRDAGSRRVRVTDVFGCSIF